MDNSPSTTACPGPAHDNARVGMGLLLVATAAFVPSLLVGLPLRAQKRIPVVAMGGFEQQQAPARAAGARVSLILNGDASLIDSLPEACRGHDESLTGTIYALSNGRFEVIAEGPQVAVSALTSRVAAAAGEALVRESAQLPVGSYDTSFPLVDLAEPSATASIEMKGDAPTIDYINRHLRTEAVFNRGLKLTKDSQSSSHHLKIVCSGKADRLKGFVRWCYLGPPLARPDMVKISWK